VIDYDRIALEYSRHRQVHPEVLRSLIKIGGIERASKVLEVGCGTGNYVIALEVSVGCSCWGIDPSAGMLTEARSRSRETSFQLGRAGDLDFQSAFFDLVFSVDVVHHLADRRQHFREARRVLRPGGKACTATDSEWIIRHREPLTVYFPETVEIELARYPRIAGLRGVMEEAGFAEMTDNRVEFPYELTDIQPYRDKAFSSLHLIEEEAFERGMQRLERDLGSGPIPCVSRYVLLWGTRLPS